MSPFCKNPSLTHGPKLPCIRRVRTYNKMFVHLKLGIIYGRSCIFWNMCSTVPCVCFFWPSLHLFRFCQFYWNKPLPVVQLWTWHLFGSMSNLRDVHPNTVLPELSIWRKVTTELVTVGRIHGSRPEFINSVDKLREITTQHNIQKSFHVVSNKKQQRPSWLFWPWLNSRRSREREREREREWES